MLTPPYCIGPAATFDRSVLQILAPNKRVVLGEISNSTNNAVSTLNLTPKKPKSSLKKKKTTTKREEEAFKTEIFVRSIDPRKSDHSPSIYCYLLSYELVLELWNGFWTDGNYTAFNDAKEDLNHTLLMEETFLLAWKCRVYAGEVGVGWGGTGWKVEGRERDLGLGVGVGCRGVAERWG
ncbi:PREDICTED: cyclin-A3-4 isoform [Prunus dulcis]|uniref:PREDICTED: cyclin-A3-4 isoform n=1 Tax=Prunus dulcis TaxID=3755 RepID=A0A5E4FQ39_PRUDU|nr:PREDICTED: cyclin-A3-4 isoform [Prunus dulcis]